MNASNLTIADYFEQVYALSALKPSQASYANYHRRAIELFERFAGQVRAGAATEAMLDEFTAFCAEYIGHADSPRKIRAILRHARPGEFSPRKGGRKPTWDASDRGAEGSLWRLFVTSYKPRRLPGRSEKHAQKVRIQLRHFSKFLGREPMLTDLSDDVLAQFLDYMAQGRAPATANTARKAVVAIWRYAADLGLVATRPTVVALPEPELIPEGWFVSQMEVLLRTIAGLPGSIDGIPRADWWTGLITFLYVSGERIGATMKIRAEWYDPAQHTVLVPAAIRKGRKKPKLYRLISPAKEALAKIAHVERGLLFPWPESVATLYRHYGAILSKAGLSSGRRSKFHRLRRTCASYIEKASPGASTAYLGHSSRALTERSYLDPRITGAVNMAELLPALQIGGPGNA